MGSGTSFFWMKLKKMVLTTDVNYNWLDIQYIQIPPPVGHTTHVEQTIQRQWPPGAFNSYEDVNSRKGRKQQQRIKRAERRERDRQVQYQDWKRSAASCTKGRSFLFTNLAKITQAQHIWSQTRHLTAHWTCYRVTTWTRILLLQRKVSKLIVKVFARSTPMTRRRP